MKKEKNKIKNKRSTSIIRDMFIAIAIFVAFANCINMYLKIRDKKQQLIELKQQYEEAVIQNEEYQYLLNDENRTEYIERVAREKYGYVAPGERAFYDSSSGK